MATEWYVKSRGKKYGPCSSSQLKQLAQKGRLTAHCKVRRGKNGQWVLASQVKGLLPTDVADVPSRKKPAKVPPHPMVQSRMAQPDVHTVRTVRAVKVGDDMVRLKMPCSEAFSLVEDALHDLGRVKSSSEERREIRGRMRYSLRQTARELE